MVPELRADVTTCSAGYIHLVLVAVVTVGAFPYKFAVAFDDLNFSVVATYLTVVTFGVQFSVHNMVVDILHDAENGGKVVLHVGYFNIADGTARR